MTSGFTVVLVHDVLTDASSWWPVTLRLLGAGHRVIAPPTGTRDLAQDAANLRMLIERIDAPVMVAAHGYGGAVATAVGYTRNLRGIVYVSGYAPEETESISVLRAGFPASDITRHLVSTLFQDGHGGAETQLSVQAGSFSWILAEGLPDDEMGVMAVSQRPFSMSILDEPARFAAWRHTPVWAVVARDDRMIHPDLQRFVATRAGARAIVEVDAPHLVMHTHPTSVVDLLLRAASELSAPR